PALLYAWNSFLFVEPPQFPVNHATSVNRDRKGAGEAHPLPYGRGSPNTADTAASLAPVAVLIPARNEELGIEACVRSVLASKHIELEVIVLDDASTDRTAEIVRGIAAEDNRVRIETAPPLPEGWCGKQHACFVLSKLARFDVFTFL